VTGAPVRGAQPDGPTIITTDRFVTHVSTVPATRGQTVGLLMRERVLAFTMEAGTNRK